MHKQQYLDLRSQVFLGFTVTKGNCNKETQYEITRTTAQHNQQIESELSKIHADWIQDKYSSHAELQHITRTHTHTHAPIQNQEDAQEFK